MEGRPQCVQWSVGDLFFRPLREGTGSGQGDGPPQPCQELSEEIHAVITELGEVCLCQAALISASVERQHR